MLVAQVVRHKLFEQNPDGHLQNVTGMINRFQHVREVEPEDHTALR